MCELRSPSQHVGFEEVAKQILMGGSKLWAPAPSVSDQWRWPPTLNRTQGFILGGKTLLDIDPHLVTATSVS